MSIKDILLLIVFLFLTVAVKAEQSNESFPEITSKDIPGCEIIRKDYFDKKTLWGYIDGGADIYLEYGFNKLLVEELNWQKQHFRVEVYQMQNPSAAFGIYSLSNGNCSSIDSLSEYSCVTAYQTVAFEDCFFISIINETGTDEAKQLSGRIAKIILGKTAGEKFHLPELFTVNEFALYQKGAKYFNGKLGLQNALPEMADQFENFRDYTVYFLPIELKEGYFNLFLINFSNENALLEFYSLSGIKPQQNRSAEYTNQNGLFKSIIKSKTGEIIYIESTLSTGNRNNYINAINHLVN